MSFDLPVPQYMELETEITKAISPMCRPIQRVGCRTTLQQLVYVAYINKSRLIHIKLRLEVSLDEKKEACTLVCSLHTFIVDDFWINLTHRFMFLHQDYQLFLFSIF